ncbi:MAG: S8 family serine peptidase [Bacilli bacterium]|nr:S8 family serine peptidase [Bacilli bacterium]
MRLFAGAIGVLASVLLTANMHNDISSNKRFFERNELSYAFEANVPLKREIDINDIFSEKNVLVTLKPEISNPEGISDELIKSIFSVVDYVEANDLSKVSITPILQDYYSKNSFNQIFCVELAYPSKEAVVQACSVLNEVEGVAYAEPDYAFLTEETASPDSTVDEQWGLFDDDDPENPQYGIGAPKAWETTKGNPSLVSVGVIDSGINDHEDLSVNISPGWDFVHNSSVTNDGKENHGTHVAGIIAARQNSIGITGVAPQVKVVPLQTESDFVDQGKHVHYVSTRISAINYATKLWGTNSQISVLNHSISGFGRSEASLYGLLNAIRNFPGVFVWSAGNEGDNLDESDYIAQYSLPNLISVGSINNGGRKAISSCYGNSVSIYAPGVNILSTIGVNGYDEDSGTSMAAPFVSGVAALLYSIDPGLESWKVKDAIIGGAKDIVIVGGNGQAYNSKRLYAPGAIEYIKNNYQTSRSPVRISVKQKNGAVWKIQVTNPNKGSVFVAYNSKMCFESDAKQFTNLFDVETVSLLGRESKDVLISENGTAGWISFAYGYETSDGKRMLMVSCANNLSANKSTFDNKVYSAEVNLGERIRRKNGNFTSNQFPKVTSAPKHLALTVKTASSWFSSAIIEVKNTNSKTVQTRYRTKLCFIDDAKKMIVSDVAKTSINANAFFNATVKPNGTADYFAASIDCYYKGLYYSYTTYINSRSKGSYYLTSINLVF